MNSFAIRPPGWETGMGSWAFHANGDRKVGCQKPSATLSRSSAAATMRIIDIRDDYAGRLRVECARFIAALVCGGAAPAKLLETPSFGGIFEQEEREDTESESCDVCPVLPPLPPFSPVQSKRALTEHAVAARAGAAPPQTKAAINRTHSITLALSAILHTPTTAGIGALLAALAPRSCGARYREIFRPASVWLTLMSPAMEMRPRMAWMTRMKRARGLSFAANPSRVVRGLSSSSNSPTPFFSQYPPSTCYSL